MATDTPPPADHARDAELRCANCGIAVDDEPVTRGARSYCCDGCSEGGPCTC